MLAALLVAVLIALVLPHRLALSAAAPTTAAAAWMLALGIRAVAGVLVAVYVVLYLPATAVFDAVTHWCLHAVVPVLATHLPLDGHSLGDAATIAPAAALVVSVLWVSVGVLRAAGAVRLWLRQHALGHGPSDAVIVGGEEVMVAVAGLRHPRIVVSAGALAQLDDDELQASLAHERAHIVRRHRYLLLVAELLRAFGRFIPGTSLALRELRFHLERDADAWAVRGRDPMALASAICKAAAPAREGLVVAALGGRGVPARVRALLDGAAPPRTPLRVHSALAASACVLTLLIAAVPASVAAGVQGPPGGQSTAEHCRD